MVNPKEVTKFNRTKAELEEFLLFSIVAAGKPAFQQARKLEEFLAPFRNAGHSPFSAIRQMDMYDTLSVLLESVKIGQYNRITTAFRGVANLFEGSHEHSPLQSVQIKHLECIKGIGMKTARFFVMHSRPNQQLACLDTHILAWLKDKGHDVPKATPNGKKYLELEKIFLAYCQEQNKLPADLDLEIWNERSKKDQK